MIARLLPLGLLCAMASPALAADSIDAKISMGLLGSLSWCEEVRALPVGEVARVLPLLTADLDRYNVDPGLRDELWTSGKAEMRAKVMTENKDAKAECINVSQALESLYPKRNQSASLIAAETSSKELDRN